MLEKIIDLWNNCQKNGQRYINAYRIVNKFPEKKIFTNLLGTNNSKVQCLTFGIPVKLTCKPILGENTICSFCYAQNGKYFYSSVLIGQIKRLYAFLSNTNRFIVSCINQINNSKYKYVRLHDSGDFFSVKYAQTWHRIAKECDKKKFFVPTKKYLNAEILEQLIKFNSLPNVVIRPSAIVLNQEAPIIEGLEYGTAVNKNFGTCKATVNHTSCIEEKCRKCWNSDCKNIVFKKH